MPKKSTEQEFKVWIELPKPPDKAHAERTAELANNMLKRIAGPHKIDKFYWSDREQRYCYGGPMGHIVCADWGHWFNLEAFGRPLSEA